MLSLYLRPDRTQIMQAQWTKDKGIRMLVICDRAWANIRKQITGIF